VNRVCIPRGNLTLLFAISESLGSAICSYPNQVQQLNPIETMSKLFFIILWGVVAISVAMQTIDAAPELEIISQPPTPLVLDSATLFFEVIKRPSIPEHLGPNGKYVDWAIFFHKPECASCRQIRPAFEALASTVNGSKHLRFAALDCDRCALLLFITKSLLISSLPLRQCIYM
jgi:thiol-disulfide isomerase/thioredoxin